MNIVYHFIFALFIRIALVLWGVFQDNIVKVKYTDIDYHVFTDAAGYVLKGESPFKSHTYRYTPFLAFLVTPNIFLHISFGKIVFCILDIVTSVLIYHILKNYGYSFDLCKKCAFMWLYNPVAMVISSRGNAESVMTTLVMFTIYFLQSSKPVLCGLTYGLSVHFKIYPCIYAPSLYLNFSRFAASDFSTKLKALYMPELNKILFVLSTILGFCLPTIISFSLYGEKYIEEAMLYHLFRKDIRHNFSIHFYLMYLSEAVQSSLSTYISILSMFAQLITILMTAWAFHSSPLFLPFSLFIETYLFVTFNKVCTSQYFLWYACLFPLAYPILNISSKQILARFALWISGQGLWLYFAYLLEFKGENVFFWVFIASLVFYFINMYLICYFINHVKIVFNKSITKKEE